jgi:hypothetical protein
MMIELGNLGTHRPWFILEAPTIALLDLPKRVCLDHESWLDLVLMVLRELTDGS